MRTFAVLALVALLAFSSGCSRYREVAKFDLGDGFVCEVKMADDLEPKDPFYYSITNTSKTVVPLTYIAGFSEGSVTEFAILSNDDRRYFGLITKERPSDILMIFDKHDKVSWPRAGDRELPADVALRGARFLASLSEGSKQRDLQLVQE